MNRLQQDIDWARARQAEAKAHHPYIYAACKFFVTLVVQNAMHLGVDAIGTCFGDPFLYEEAECIFYGSYYTYQISKALYEHLKSTQHIHRQPIEYIKQFLETYTDREHLETYAENLAQQGASFEIQQGCHCTIS